MSLQGVARKTRSVISFPSSLRPESDDQQLRKRSRKEADNDNTSATPDITITHPTEDLEATSSFATVIQAPAAGNLDVHDVTKLERLVDKSDRYESHKSFLEQCIQNKIVPVGLEINLTPTIGNNSDKFVDQWHKRLKEFSVIIMQDIIQFCDETLNTTQSTIDEMKSKVKSTATQEETDLIMNSISEDQKVRRENLRRGKQKKIHFIKYKRNHFQNNNYRDNYNNNRNHHEKNNYNDNNNWHDHNHAEESNDYRSNNPRGNQFARKPQISSYRNNYQSTRTTNQYQTQHNGLTGNILRKSSDTYLAKKRSDSRITQKNDNTANIQQPKLWSALLKPTTNTPGASSNGNQPNDTDKMKERIKELENELANQREIDTRTRITYNQSKNLEPSPRDHTIYLSNPGSTGKSTNHIEQPNPMEINDLLQVISTTMATLKDFESRFENLKSI